MITKALVAAMLLVVATTGCTGAGEAPQPTSATPPPAPVASPAPGASEGSERSEPPRIAAAYREYTEAISHALADGAPDLPALTETASGQALRDARARIRANDRDDVATAGELEPSATAAEVVWDGGDTATISDCVLNGLSYVEPDRLDIVTTEANGTRRPVEAELSRRDGAWVVTHVEMPQEEDIENPQEDPPFLRGPMPDGPPSCAPPELEQEILAGYLAFWDAFDRAFGFGRDGPANPDDPALAATSVDPQLSSTRDFFQERREDQLSVRGEPDQRDPWVLAVTDFDRRAIVGDCVSLGASRTIQLPASEVVSRNKVGQLDYEETVMVLRGRSWKAANWQTIAEGLTECDSPT